MKLYSYEAQLKNIISKNTQHDYESIAREILRKMSLTEIIDSMSYFQNFDKFTYSKLCEQFDLLGYLPSEKSKKSYGFETMIDQQFAKEYSSARISLNTGDIISFLIGKYVECRDNENVFLEIAYQNLIDKIIILIKQQLPALRTEIESQSFIPIQKALYVFFLFEKEDAFQKFKKIIRYDLEQRRTSNFEIEHFVNEEVFFERLALSYIPQIDTLLDPYTISLSAPNESITRNEIKFFLNKGDYFNKNVPLINIEVSKFFNPLQDFVNYKVVEKIFSVLFDEFYRRTVFTFDYKIPSQNIGKIFLANISQPSSVYHDIELINTREIIIELLTKSEDFKGLFFMIIYHLKDAKYMLRGNTLFPYLFSEYLGSISGYSVSTLKTYFTNDDKNPLMWRFDDAGLFLKKHGFNIYTIDNQN